MKNKQKGFIGFAVAIVIALILGGGGAYYYNQSKVDNKSTEEDTTINTNVENSTTQNSNPGQVKVNTDIKTEIKSDSKMSSSLTEDDILKATYKLSANFDGTKTVPLNVIFPQSHDKSRVLSGTVSISQKGLLENPSGQAPSGEAFWIYKYEYVNSVKTEARVYIAGNFGASGTDNRVFKITKVNGVVKTEEISSNTQINSETADWKTYKNEKYSFEFQYPLNTLVKEDSTRDNFSSTSFLVYELNGFHQIVYVYTKPTTTDLNAWYAQTFKKQANNPVDESYVTINNYSALKVTYNVMDINRAYYFIDGGSVVLGFIYDSNKLPVEMDSDHLKLINSIKFTK